MFELQISIDLKQAGQGQPVGYRWPVGSRSVQHRSRSISFKMLKPNMLETKRLADNALCHGALQKDFLQLCSRIQCGKEKEQCCICILAKLLMQIVETFSVILIFLIYQRTFLIIIEFCQACQTQVLQSVRKTRFATKWHFSAHRTLFLCYFISHTDRPIPIYNTFTTLSFLILWATAQP